MRYLLGACVGMLILVVQPSIAKEGTAKCPTLKFERRQVITLQDLGRLVTDVKSTKDGAGTIVFRLFDVEDRPWRGGAHAVGLIFAKMGDLGETPLGGYLWMTDSTEAVVGEPVIKGDGRTVSMAFTTEQNPAACPPAAFTFTLKPDGAFDANGVLVGTVSLPD